MSEDALPPSPWDKPHRRTAPARVPLSRTRIVEAAFTVLDREGLDGLSMRQVAAELGVAVSALYAHVSSKDELLELMYHQLFEEFDLPEPDSEHWQDQIRDFVRQGRERLRQHRDMARISMAHAPFSAELLPKVEQLLAIFRTAGLPDRISAIAGDLLTTYLDGFVLEEGMWANRMRRAAEEDGEASWKRLRDEMESYFAALPRDRFPHLVALAGLMADETQDQRFELGLEIILRGLASYLDEGRRDG
jgi:AcrR family transcriptional regulator